MKCNAFTLSLFRKLEFLGIFPTASNRKLAGKNQLAQSQIIKSNTISSPLSATNLWHQHLLYRASTTQFVTSKPWANSSRLYRLRKNSCLKDSKRRNERPNRTYLKTIPFQFILQLQITVSVLNLRSWSLSALYLSQVLAKWCSSGQDYLYFYSVFLCALHTLF